MNAREIDILVEKYWDCDTSREEECLLKEFFSQTEEIPDHLIPLKSIFVYQKAQFDVCLNEAFDKKILSLISQEEGKAKKEVSLSQVMKIAAVALLCVIVGAVTVYLSAHKNTTTYSDTYKNPQEAMFVIRHAVSAVGNNLQEGRQESVNAISTLNKFNEYIQISPKANIK
ncbi:MAG: hypothetical protein FWF54_06010 [Candidatus Azobacteroides sp.]|nr:hypothetical protein [Candidatus Azobacteroides sp.]